MIPPVSPLNMKKFSVAILSLSVILAACGQGTVKVGGDKVLEVKTYNATMQGARTLVDPVHGKETRFAYGAIDGVNGVRANGVGYIHTFADGVTIVTANLNILQAPAGKRYILWGSNVDGSKVVFGGDLESILGDARHTGKFQMKEDAASVGTLVVTLETIANPSLPGSHQAEGVMKEYKRK